MSRVDLDPVRWQHRAREHRTAQVSNICNALAGRKPMGKLAHLALSIAINEEIGFRIQEDRAAHLLRPIIKMRNAPQGSFNSADDDRHTLERLAHALRIDNDGAVRALAAGTAGRIGIIAPDAPLSGIAVHHGVHVAGGDAEKKVRTAKSLKRRGAVPIRLGNDADAKSLCLKRAEMDALGWDSCDIVLVTGDDYVEDPR